jgi:uncharacterized metal-binding protein YceD (DUF177 family)
MTEPSPEFSRLVPLARCGAGPFRLEIAATPDECAALALRFRLLGVDRLRAAVVLQRQPDETILLDAEFEAAFTQECVVSLDPAPGTVAERFTLRYAPAEAEPEDDGGAGDDPAFEPLTGDAIDIGEAVAQEFSLALPPFPRAPGAEVELDAAADDDGPFAALAGIGKPPTQG